ncbi:MAG: hypothetical protein AAF696_14100 [Bacteroidota bacterium]
MSTLLSQHSPPKERVFKLPNPQTATDDLKAFLLENIVLVLLGEFHNSDLHTDSASILCVEGHSKQACIWIKDPETLLKVRAFLSQQLALFNPIAFDKVRALAFSMNTEKVAYIIEKNPSDEIFRLSKAEMSIAFDEAMQPTNSHV